MREEQCAAKDLELQREILARAAKARHEAEAKGAAEGAGQLGAEAGEEAPLGEGEAG